MTKQQHIAAVLDAIASVFGQPTTSRQQAFVETYVGEIVDSGPLSIEAVKQGVNAYARLFGRDGYPDVETLFDLVFVLWGIAGGIEADLDRVTDGSAPVPRAELWPVLHRFIVEAYVLGAQSTIADAQANEKLARIGKHLIATAAKRRKAREGS